MPDCSPDDLPQDDLHPLRVDESSRVPRTWQFSLRSLLIAVTGYGLAALIGRRSPELLIVAFAGTVLSLVCHVAAIHLSNVRERLLTESHGARGGASLGLLSYLLDISMIALFFFSLILLAACALHEFGI
jgi:hypothetical protein